MNKYLFSSFLLFSMLLTACNAPSTPEGGEQSGGGSCCVSMLVTAEGVPYRGSSIARLVNKDHIEFDTGVLVDHELTAEESFNGTIVNEVMNQFYGVIDSEMI